MHKNSSNGKTLLLILLTVCGIVWFFYKQVPQEQNPTVTVEIANVQETSSVDPEKIMSDSITYTTAAETDITLPDTAAIDVPYISQYPELPTGCEITSLAEVLNFYGFAVNKEELAANYLPMKDYIEPGCFIEYFYGSPWSEHGSGCFAPTIVASANHFLTDMSSSLRAYSISYAPVKNLFSEVAQGHPVIVWTCFEYDTPEFLYRDIDLGNGQIFSWPAKEHCTVLTGYNLAANTVTLADPTYGIIERNIDEFSYYYKMYFYQAAVIR